MFYDTSDNPIPSFSLTLSAGSSYVMRVRIDCRANKFLKSEIANDATVEGRKLGDSTWVNLVSSEIDLSPYAGDRETFEIRITADDPADAANTFKLYTY